MRNIFARSDSAGTASPWEAQQQSGAYRVPQLTPFLGLPIDQKSIEIPKLIDRPGPGTALSGPASAVLTI